MDWEVVARCVYLDLTAAISVTYHTTYVDLKSEIYLRFKELNIGYLELRYSLQNQSNCLLTCDSDIHVMLKSAFWEKVHFVDIQLVASSLSIGSSHLSLASSSTSSVGESNNDVGIGDDYLGVYKPSEHTKLLSTDWKDLIRGKYQSFDGGAKEFREKLRKFAMESGFEFVFVKNEPKRVTVECAKKYSDGCKWRVHASMSCSGSTFFIKTFYAKHTCSGVIRENKSKMTRSTVVCSTFLDQIRKKPSIRPVDMAHEFKENYGFDIPYHIAWKGKELAKAAAFGDDASSFNRLHWYVDAIIQSNPESHVVLERDPITFRFIRLFICFGGCIQGFQYCRPLLFLDGTFIKNKYRGQLLSATGKNGNDGLYPFAFAIVDSENETNWKWFLKNLYDVVSPQGREITFISDRNLGLLKSFPVVFPTGHLSFCMLHLKRNLNSRFGNSVPKELREKILEGFSRCLYAPTELVFQYEIDMLLKDGGNVVKDFLSELPKHHWASAYFKGRRYNEMCNNCAESFNAWVLEERSMPIYKMVDSLRSKLMSFNGEHFMRCKDWYSVLCPELEKKLHEKMLLGSNWIVKRASECVFEVRGRNVLTVDLKNRTCSCYQWQLKSFPCAHALCAIQKDSGCIYDYIEDYFKTSFFKKSYSFPIFPVTDIEQSIVLKSIGNVLKPPITRKPPGRPRQSRFKSVGERGPKTRRCGRCGQHVHHNKTTCTAPISN